MHISFSAERYFICKKVVKNIFFALAYKLERVVDAARFDGEKNKFILLLFVWHGHTRRLIIISSGI